MNHLHRHISPKIENKDLSVRTSLLLMLICLLLLILKGNVLNTKIDLRDEQLEQVSQQQKAIFSKAVKLEATKINRKIKYQQALLEKLNQRLASQSFHSNSDLKKLRRLYQEYQVNVKISAESYDSEIELLRQRMLTVDSSIVVAMAALESNWGRSKKALYTNNYFLKTCLVLDCQPPVKHGQKDDNLSDSRKLYVFNDFSESIKMLINLINTHERFQVFRNTRAGFLRRAKLYTPQQIIGTLKYASIYTETEFQALEKLIAEGSL